MLDLKSLGFTDEELKERVVNQVCTQILHTVGLGEDGEEYSSDSKLARDLATAIKARVDQKINELAEKHVLPKVSEYIENLCLQTTNKWGEARGEKLSFIEYLTDRADAYMREDVDYEGKAKDSNNSYNWKKSQSRISHMVDKHLHYSIDSAMKAALATANGAISEGIAETVKIKLDEIVKGLQTTVVVKR